MTTPLDKTLKRALVLNEQEYVVAISPVGLKMTLKGKRNGLELSWLEVLNSAAATSTAAVAPSTTS